MKITRIEPFILHVPVTGSEISDSTHRITHWGAPGVIIHTDSGLRGYGYTGTHAHLPTDRLITNCATETYGPLLLGEDPENVLELWNKLFHFPPAQWVGRSGITQLALSAVDVALWDLKAKAASQPLWKFLGGGAATPLEAYNTDGGWLNSSTQQLVDGIRRQVEEEGYRGVKMKVGGADLYQDLERIAAVRKAIGARVKLMADANGRLNLATALRFGRKLEEYDVYWFEEPLWYDDVSGHAALARAIRTPIALGEQLYRLDDFRNFIAAGAVHVVQADAVRLAGITEWWQVADLALAYRLPVVPHIGDMMQIHIHLSIAHPACNQLEYIPWLRECFVEPVSVKDGLFVTPETPGAGTTIRPAALERYNVL
ncbi:MAG TPA: mandelate racemase/muconate lactonizing enzyme family protein [Terriglobia bacterium]|nr:mandelate racemase/muconate lactonizing enzyme family protein [Terriglobia bacterium]